MLHPGWLFLAVAGAFPLPRLSGPIVLDGRRDDTAWQSVPTLPLTVHLPNFGREPTERTEARVAYDGDAIYVLVDAWEAHPSGVRASSMVRDDASAPGDFINVIFDSFGDGQNAVGFTTTPGGQRIDFTVANDARDAASLSPAWNGVWDVAVRRDAAGWHAEFRIPFSTLRFQERDGRVEFGLSVNRKTAHSNERVTFPAIEPTNPNAIWMPSRFARVAIEGIHPRRSVRLLPYVIGGMQGLRSPDPVRSPWTRDNRLEAGGDFKAALAANVTLDLTANTDFAEVEDDDQRINLTRYPLFFPERRAFFVERAGTFDFRTGETDILFNSRRVGLTPAGDPVRLLGGARLVGRMGGWDVGLFDAEAGPTPAGIHENLGVLRLKHGVVDDRSWIGLMTASRVTSDSAQLAVGVDGDLHLGHDDYAGFSAVGLWGDADAGTGRGFLPRGALRLLVERRRNLGLWYRATVATTGSRYAPALGYVERGNAIRPGAELGYGRIVSRSGHQLRVSGLTSLAYHNAGGGMESGTATGQVALQMPSGALWSLGVTQQSDELTGAFAPTPKTTVPSGRYGAGYVQLAYAAAPGPKVALGGSVRAGGYFDGTLYSVLLSPEWRASAHFRAGADFEVDRVAFAARGQHEWSRLARVRILASASPRLSLSALLQVNSLADKATGNLRLRYNVREGHDLWIVYDHHLNLDRDRWDPRAPATARAGVLVKYTRSVGR